MNKEQLAAYLADRLCDHSDLKNPALLTNQFRNLCELIIYRALEQHEETWRPEWTALEIQEKP